MPNTGAILNACAAHQFVSLTWCGTRPGVELAFVIAVGTAALLEHVLQG